jgi:hypothetical protein
MGKVTTFLGNMVNISSVAGKGNVSKFCIKFKLDVGFWRTYYGKLE